MYRVDPLAQSLIVFAVLGASFLTVYAPIDVDTALKGLLFLSLMISGILFGIHLGSLKFTGARARDILYYGIVGVAGIMAAQLLAVNALSVTPGVVIVTLAAISEECFFRGFIAAWMMVQTKNIILAVVLTSAIFAMYHIVVYNTTEQLFAVFLSSIVLTFIFLRTRYLGASMVAHLVFNIYAIGGFGI